MARQMPSVRNPNIINLHVSINYVKSWGKWHAIREFYQNLYDACLTLLNNNVANLEVDHQPNSMFVFADKSQNPHKTLAFIEYNPSTHTLVLSNELGNMKLSTRCLILGGSDASKHTQPVDSPLAGQFGEGFKLAILSLVREGCNVSVLVRNDTWRFFLQEDPIFENERCLYVELIKETQRSTVIEITINGINAEDFATARRRLLLISDINPQYQYVTSNGVILLAPEYANHMFVRGIYVSEKPCGWYQAVGYNTYNLKLDRDRMAFQEPAQMLSQTSLIFANTIDHYVLDPLSLSQAKILVDRVYKYICSSQLSHLHSSIAQAASLDLFWAKFAEFHPSKQPTSVNQQPEYSVATKFPNVYVVIDHYLYHIIRKSHHFRDPYQWLAEFTTTRKECVLSTEEKQQLDFAVEWIKTIPALKIENVKVLENHTHHNDLSCVKNKCFYVPRALVDKEKEVLSTVDRTDVGLGKTLQVMVVRSKSSDNCISLDK